MSGPKKTLRRSHQWFGEGWLKMQGAPLEAVDGRPIIGICNTWSEADPWQAHFPSLAQQVKNGVWEAGGFPIEVNTMGLGERIIKPTAMLYRNLLSMEVEECLRANPFDGVVLLAGSDKSLPGALMGALSCDLPTLVVSGGPSLNPHFRGKPLGSPVPLLQMHAKGELTQEECAEAIDNIWRSPGICHVMGTASTMACIAEIMGLSLPGHSTIPAADVQMQRQAFKTGQQIVRLVEGDIHMSDLLTRKAFENAVRIVAAMGGSTNAVIHLMALAGRTDVSLSMQDMDRLASDVPLLLNIMPHGEFMMEDFHRAGGLMALAKELGDRLHLDCKNGFGSTLGQVCQKATNFNPQVIHSIASPLKPPASLAILTGNLSPNGCVIKPSAASPQLMEHRGQALVFDSIEDLRARIHSPDLAVDANTVLVLRGCGPRGYPGMPEVGNLPIPQKLQAQGVKDMVRISDARMSGTAYGTVVLHASPESSVGGPLGLIQTGDWIRLSVSQRQLSVELSDSQLAERRAKWTPPPAAFVRGYGRLFIDHVLQADTGADFDFLRNGSRPEPLRHNQADLRV